MVFTAALFTAIFVLATAAGIALIVRMAREAGPQIEALREARRAAPAVKVYRITVREVVRRAEWPILPVLVNRGMRQRGFKVIMRRAQPQRQHAVAA